MFFFFSKWLHKYLGLGFFALFLLMAASGILLNHPSLIAHWSVPVGLLGKSYQYANWNRFSFRDSLVLSDGAILVAGKMGVFISRDDGAPFEPMNEGLPESLYMRDTRCLLVTGQGRRQRFFAGTRGGLFFRDRDNNRWLPVKTAGPAEEIVDLVLAGRRIIAFIPHGCMSAPVGQQVPVFQDSRLIFQSAGETVPGYRLLFGLHSGKLFGLPGRLLIDLGAALLIFLCLSACCLWYIPWSRRRFRFAVKKTRLFAFMYRHHLRFGIWTALLLLLIGLTGSLTRPPLLALIYSWQIPSSWINQGRPEVLKAAVTGDGSLIIATRNGWFKGDADLREPLFPVTPPFPVFGMGATVLEPLADNRLLAGSFSGLYIWDPDKETAVDLAGKAAENTGSVRPAKVMAAGAMVRDGMLIGYADYRKGLQGPDNEPMRTRSLPADLHNNRLSLYHLLFELHNGRILRDLIGRWYIFFVPLAGSALLLITLTGIYDWCRRKLNRLSGTAG